MNKYQIAALAFALAIPRGAVAELPSPGVPSTRSAATVASAELPPSVSSLLGDMLLHKYDDLRHTLGLWPAGSRELSEALRDEDVDLAAGRNPLEPRVDPPLVSRDDAWTEVGFWEALDPAGKRIAGVPVVGARRPGSSNQAVPVGTIRDAMKRLLEPFRADSAEKPAVVRFTHRHPPGRRSYSVNDRRLALEIARSVHSCLPGTQVEMGLVWQRRGRRTGDPGKRVYRIGRGRD